MPQIKVTIDDKIYKQLKKEAKDNFRTITNEINYRLQQSFIPAPITPTTPTYIPHGAPGGIPVEPYKITLSADTTTPAPANTKPSTTQTGEPIGHTYLKEHTPTITMDEDDEPEPEWDADRGHTRPRVRGARDSSQRGEEQLDRGSRLLQDKRLLLKT